MHAGEPYLQNVLRFFVASCAESIAHEDLGLAPRVKAEHPPALVNRYRLAKCLHTRIVSCKCKRLQARKVKPVGTRHEDARNRIPNADEFDGRPFCGKDARELCRLIVPSGWSALL